MAKKKNNLVLLDPNVMKLQSIEENSWHKFVISNHQDTGAGQARASGGLYRVIVVFITNFLLTSPPQALYVWVWRWQSTVCTNFLLYMLENIAQASTTKPSQLLFFFFVDLFYYRHSLLLSSSLLLLWICFGFY